MFSIKPYLSYIVQNIKHQLRPLGSDLYNVRPEHYVLSNEAFCLSLMMMNVIKKIMDVSYIDQLVT